MKVRKYLLICKTKFKRQESSVINGSFKYAI